VSNTPFREYKHWVHEGGIGTPLIAHWPAGIKTPGEMRRQPGHLIDVMATILDVSGADFPGKIDEEPTMAPEGMSLRPLFTADVELDRKPIFWEHEGNRALRDGRWKLVAKDPRGKWELYDIEADRTEQQNMIDANPEVAERMIDLWFEEARRTKALPWPWAQGKPPARRN
jgi:arylsulfatase